MVLQPKIYSNVLFSWWRHWPTIASILFLSQECVLNEYKGNILWCLEFERLVYGRNLRSPQLEKAPTIRCVRPLLVAGLPHVVLQQSYHLRVAVPEEHQHWEGYSTPGTCKIDVSTMHRHHNPHQHESKYQTDHPKYLAQKWRGVSLCRLHTLIEAPFSKRRLTTCDWTMDIVTVLVREEYLRVAITRCQKQWGSAPAVFQAQHLLSSLLSFQQLLNARQWTLTGGKVYAQTLPWQGQGVKVYMEQICQTKLHLNARQGSSTGSQV